MLEWDNLTCVHQTSTGPKTVLLSISGSAQPMQMTAIMGPSGAGQCPYLIVGWSMIRLFRLWCCRSCLALHVSGRLGRTVCCMWSSDVWLSSVFCHESCVYFMKGYWPMVSGGTQFRTQRLDYTGWLELNNWGTGDVEQVQATVCFWAASKKLPES